MTCGGGNKTDHENDPLVDELYATIVTPERYDELLRAWESHITDALNQLVDTETFRPPIADQVESHFTNALTILERLGRVTKQGESISDSLDNDPRPAMLVDAKGLISYVNAAAGDVFQIGSGENIASLPMDADGLAKFSELLSRLDDHQPGRLLAITRVFPDEGTSAFVIALMRVEGGENESPLGLMSVVNIVWTDRLKTVLSKSFGLSSAECAVLEMLIGGSTTTQIANIRNTSVETVRTQVRSVLRKTEAHSQTELIRMAAALAQFDVPSGENLARQTKEEPLPAIRLNGRRLSFAKIGAKDGRPVLFLHGMIDGFSGPLFNRRHFEKRDICAIVPARPGYGTSEPYPKNQHLPLSLADDLDNLMAHLGIDRCPVIGHFAGALYANAFAAQYPERVTSVLCISGTVPIIHASEVSAFAPRQRVIAYTSRVMPQISKLILRAGIALLDKGGHSAFMRALYEKSPVDYEFARQPHVLSCLAEGYDFSAAQGYEAFQTDAMLMINDWSDLVCRDVPTTFIHGEHDPAMPISLIRNFAKAYDHVELIERPGLGQLHFFAAPQPVFDWIEAAIST